ncbi:LysR substrate-binding domain-containing protein [Beijerinckia sp. L45]|uniref:LysR substrate-binding domain-containing protein n=1 Tax=Beijerinckia sp. L45 TaxID=1641855 RepID=UPI00131DDA5A|nr:LysR substrate-binding domain-containing protein [Beijerinckia sp. L45]
MRSLPPLHALHVFEVAARTGSYVSAAAELGLTHGAVSRQIASLETWLGQRLFVRVGRRMAPTPAAQAFAAEVSISFDRLITAAEACGRPAVRRVLRVSAPTTFAMRWLIPRLDAFHAAHPDAEVIVATTTTLHEDLRGGFDLAVRRSPRSTGAGHAWGAYRAVPFLDEADTLVASPALLRRKPLDALADVADHMLLATETRSGDWTEWLHAASLPQAVGRRRMFDHFFVTLQAAKDGLGLGIGPFPVLSADLAEGHLVAPFPHITVPRSAYVALVPNDVDKTPTLSAFVRWLLAEGSEVPPATI